MEKTNVHLPDFSVAAKLFCTVFFILLGVGILVSQLKVVTKYRMADGKPMLSVRDLVLSYHGYPGAPIVEVKLRLAPTPDHKEFEKKMYKDSVDYLIQWTKDGASAEKDDFEPVVEALENYCVNCHDLEGAAKSSPFWEDRVVKHDLVAPVFSRTGAVSANRLLHLTHVHLLSNVMIFVLTGAVVLFCRMGPKLKTVLLLLPFLGIFLDIGSWWVTAFICHHCAWLLMLGGALMGVGFLLQFLAVMHGLWLQKVEQPA